MWLEKDIIVDIVSGIFEPQGLLPFPMPLNMESIETHCEDTVWDIECYRDELGHLYETTYGLNYQGIIQDERVKKYREKNCRIPE
jgi:beta-glucosidase